jgi:hypothetical protein
LIFSLLSLTFDWNSQLAWDTGLHYTNTTFDLHRTVAERSALARSILFDDKYDADKAIIMKPLDIFDAHLDARTQEQVNAVRSELTFFFVLPVLCYSIIPVCSVLLVLSLKKLTFFWESFGVVSK